MNISLLRDPLAVVFLSALVCSEILVCLVPLLRRRLLDQPSPRSSHCQPIPRGGGIAFVLVILVASGLGRFSVVSSGSFDNSFRHLTLFSLTLAALPLALVGLLDDRLNLPTSWRYGAQLATALGLILLSPLPCPWLALPLLLIAATAVINFTNFMDGLDGLVAGCMAITFAAACLQQSAPWPLWALVGALLGFLLWNWSPAKVFMGDVGSTFLGALFVGLVLQARSWPEALGLLLVATPLLADACLCVLRRLRARQRIFQAHRLHLFQRLHQAGWSHARVASLYIAATVALSAALLWGGLLWVLGLAVVQLFVGVWLDQRVALPFAVASRAVLSQSAVPSQ
jgi:Fuc2NAc and GlcNAc transferase